MNRELETLKALGLRGAARGFVTMTSSELGDILGVSQQTASNRILELLEDGLIERKMGTRHQRLKISRKGYDRLYRELAELQAIFMPPEEIVITGKVSTGLGEGRYYVGQYKKYFKNKLGFTPFEGTLNLTVGEGEIAKLAMAPSSSYVEIEGFKADGRSFGNVRCLPARIGDLDGAIVIPKRSHHNDVIEVLAQFNLRRTMKLDEGDEVEIVIGL